MRRGFKTEAEVLVQRLRDEQGLSPLEQMDPLRLAAHVDVEVIAADALVDRRRLEHLERLQPGALSACTFHPTPDRTVIVYNPLMSLARRNSDLAHELAHVLLDHKLSRVEKLDSLSFLVCDDEQEKEAEWLSGCLLLPRPLLLAELRRGRSESEIASDRALSVQMVRYRINVTGVSRQLASARPGQHSRRLRSGQRG